MRSAAAALRDVTTLSLAAPAPPQVCTLTTHAVLRVGDRVREYSTLWRVRKSLRQVTPAGGGVFDVATLARVQTPVQGAEQLTADLAALLHTLVVETDRTGRVVRVVNKPQLRAQWANQVLPGLQKKYRGDPEVPPALLAQLGHVLDGDDALEEVLAESPEYGVLFPPLYGRPLSTDVPVAGTAVLAQFVGAFDLPLRTEARLVPAGAGAAGTAAVQVVGEVEAARYPAADVRRALSALFDQPRLDARVAALHQETYAFGPRHELVEAARHTRGEIQGVGGRQLTVLLHTRDQ